MAGSVADGRSRQAYAKGFSDFRRLMLKEMLSSSGRMLTDLQNLKDAYAKGFSADSNMAGASAFGRSLRANAKCF